MTRFQTCSCIVKRRSMRPQEPRFTTGQVNESEPCKSKLSGCVHSEARQFQWALIRLINTNVSRLNFIKHSSLCTYNMHIFTLYLFHYKHRTGCSRNKLLGSRVFSGTKVKRFVNFWLRSTKLALSLPSPVSRYMSIWMLTNNVRFTRTSTSLTMLHLFRLSSSLTFPWPIFIFARCYQHIIPFSTALRATC